MYPRKLYYNHEHTWFKVEGEMAHESVKNFGVGAEITATVAEEAFDYLMPPLKGFGAEFCPMSFSLPLERYVLPGFENIVNAIGETIQRSGLPRFEGHSG